MFQRLLSKSKTMQAQNDRRIKLTAQDISVVPRDEEGYTISYDYSDIAGIQEFFALFGFVVIHDVLDAKECQATIDEIWDVQEKHSGDIVKREDQNTWDRHWPGIHSEGISGGAAIVKPQFVRNRCNPKIYRVASVLLAEDKLLTNIDRFGIFRPTKDHPERKTTRNLHFDFNPVYWYESQDAQEEAQFKESLDYSHAMDLNAENNLIGSRATADGKKVHIQGLINLADNREEDGGFIISPGFHAKFESVTESRLNLWHKQFGLHNRFCVLPEEGNEDIHNRAIRVTARRGSLVFWSQLSPHGSAPNNSDKLRYAQYIKMFPASSVAPDRAKNRSAAIKKLLDKEHIPELSDLGKKLHGLKKW